MEITQRLGNMFRARCIQDPNSQIPQTYVINKRLELAVTLFYNVLEKILVEEKKKLNDISVK